MSLRFARDAEGLAAARSRSRSDNTLCCHSLRSRHYATSSPTTEISNRLPTNKNGRFVNRPYRSIYT